MRNLISGIHHITAITNNAQQNYDFYHGVLGLHLVKKTVNYDDPSAYHLYYGDSVGSPGSLITFFVWNVANGMSGTGEVGGISFAVSRNSLDFWKQRLASFRIAFNEQQHQDESILEFSDYDGLTLRLVGCGNCDNRPGSDAKEITAEHAVRGIHSAILCVDAKCATASTLVEMGYESISKEQEATHYENKNSPFQSYLELIERPNLQKARLGSGSIHHIAFRVESDSAQLQVKKKLHSMGLHETAVIDRTYFHSVYFREGNGILFEIATDIPGFSVDEVVLGQSLVLPPWLEKNREMIMKGLPLLETQ